MTEARAIELVYGYAKYYYFSNSMLPTMTYEDLQQACCLGLVRYKNNNPDSPLTPAFIKGLVRTVSKSYKKSQMVVPGTPLYVSSDGKTRDAPRPFQVVFIDSIDYLTQNGDLKLLEIADPSTIDPIASEWFKCLTPNEKKLCLSLLSGHSLAAINLDEALCDAVLGRRYNTRWVRRMKLEEKFNRAVLKLERYS